MVSGVTTPVNIYSTWSAWAQPAGNTDTYLPGYNASQDQTAGGASMILVVLNSFGGNPAITYGGTSAVQLGPAESGGGPAYMLFDLKAHPPANTTLSGFTNVGTGGAPASIWTAITTDLLVASQTICATGPSSGAPLSSVTLDFTALFAAGCLVIVGCGVDNNSNPTVSSTDSAAIFSAVSPNPYGNGSIVVAYQFPATAPKITIAAGGVGVFNANSTVFYAANLVTVYGKGRGQKVFRPVSLVNVGTINPKIYAPGENITVKSQS